MHVFKYTLAISLCIHIYTLIVYVHMYVYTRPFKTAWLGSQQSSERIKYANNGTHMLAVRLLKHIRSWINKHGGRPLSNLLLVAFCVSLTTVYVKGSSLSIYAWGCLNVEAVSSPLGPTFRHAFCGVRVHAKKQLPSSERYAASCCRRKRR